MFTQFVGDHPPLVAASNPIVVFFPFKKHLVDKYIYICIYIYICPTTCLLKVYYCWNILFFGCFFDQNSALISLVLRFESPSLLQTTVSQMFTEHPHMLFSKLHENAFCSSDVRSIKHGFLEFPHLLRFFFPAGYKPPSGDVPFHHEITICFPATLCLF